jgi:hypothetical protein
MSKAVVGLIGESYFVLVCEDTETYDLYLGIAECSSQEQAHNICNAMNETDRLDDQFISYGGTE